MKEHSQRFNIKTTRLASLTAIFHQKKRIPHTGEAIPTTSRMDVDPPEQENHEETALHEPTLLRDDNEAEEGSDDGGDGGSEDEGPRVDSDSEDEFESDEEGPGGGDGCGWERGILDFELEAAEAGSVPYHARSAAE